jgi:2-succinyl-6-hydroxy-2,4-cyclohexadiene-1-carboxylate synthase
MIPTVFIHGLFGHPNDFQSVKNTEDICLNLEDFDQDQLSFEIIGRSITSYLSQINKIPCHLVGYSMGGRMALSLKTQFPHLYQRCILIGTNPTLDPLLIPERILFQLHFELLLAFMPVEHFFSIWYSNPIFNGLKKEKITQTRHSINKFFHQKCLNQLNILYESIEVENLILHQKDLLFAYGSLDKKYEKIHLDLEKKGFMIQKVPDSSHATIIDNPPSMKTIIKEFFYNDH